MKKTGLEKNGNRRGKAVRSAKECTYLAVFVALVIALQTVFSAVPGVELVTVMFVAYAFVMGAKRGMLAAVAFSLLRQFIFGIYPKVLVLYLIYFPLLTLAFGLLGGRIKRPVKGLVFIILAACLGTVIFTLLDNILTPLWLGYNARDARLYFTASLPFLFPQTACTAVSVATLFLPLHKIFSVVKNRSLGG